MDTISLTAIISVLLLAIGIVLTIVSARLRKESEDRMTLLPGSGFMLSQQETKRWAWLGELLHDLSSEFYGAAVTTLLLGVVLVVAQRSESENARKHELVLQMASSNSAAAEIAVRQLAALGWLYDGTLSGAWLVGANLEGIRLQLGEDFAYDPVTGIIRVTSAGPTVNFYNANLDAANLRRVEFLGANLGEAFLESADLEEADLRGANLVGAYLFDANLEKTNLNSVILDETTTLPDGTKWTPDTDMTRFTDPDHPQFWRSDDPDSPAYRGDPQQP
ncbi:MAG: pentapeptide repeat-containing protein [Anaerolineae bacterium]|nr:pentapeptide repeat-containing protein [Anaerolineae bacterium]